MLDPDRISVSCFLARATERQSGRALSQRCEKVLRFLHYLPTSGFSGFAPGRLAGAFSRAQFSVPRMAPHFDVREATSQAQKLAEIAKLVDDFLIFQPTGCLGQCATKILTSMRWTGHRLRTRSTLPTQRARKA